jgi:nitrite reductase (NADH) small subunit
MTDFKIGRTEDLSEGERICVTIEETPLAVFRVEGELYAVDNLCPHMNGDLSEGELNGHILVCPLHAWEFDIRNGKCLAPAWHRNAKDLTRYPVTVTGEEIIVELPPSDRESI